MEKLKSENGNGISARGREAAADELGCDISDIKVVNVGGGFSRNRRSLVGYCDRWIFAKEVDIDLLPNEGVEELGWLFKDCECVNTIIGIAPELVPDWEKLSPDGHVLLMPGYRSEDGWSWSVPEIESDQQKYIQTVIDAAKKLEGVKFDEAAIKRINFNPFFRDKIALDDGLALIIQNEETRDRLKNKYEIMALDESLVSLRPAIQKMQALLCDESAMQNLSICAASLIEQPNDCFGHCDVRSDNITYNSLSGQVKFVDWNWATFVPSRFGSTEFLMDMSRRGIDVTPWLDELNIELLAAIVGLYLNRSTHEQLAPGNTLRDFQAQSAVVALDLYDRAISVKP